MEGAEECGQEHVYSRNYVFMVQGMFQEARFLHCLHILCE